MERNAKVTTLKGIGEKTAKLFGRLDIETVDDLIRYYPRDYERFDPPTPIGTIGVAGVYAVEGVIVKAVEVKQMKNIQIVTTSIRDDSGILRVTWFNMPFLRNTVKRGMRIILRGRVQCSKYEMCMEQPTMYTPAAYDAIAGSMQPIYGLTAGLTNRTVQQAVKQALEKTDTRKDCLPAAVRKKYELAELNFALETIHFPTSEENLLFARKRLVFEEFFYFITGIRLMKEKQEVLPNAFPVRTHGLADRLIGGLPYELTDDQKKVWSEILGDMQGDGVMNRLIQGDVGSGKTVLAVLAMVTAAENGYQSALMAPTEVLARQHYQSLLEFLEPLGLGERLVLLTGSMTAKEKREAYRKLKEHEADFAVGTHALIQDKVEFAALSLVITDEQHRFGVKQRAQLAGKSGESRVKSGESCLESEGSRGKPDRNSAKSGGSCLEPGRGAEWEKTAQTEGKVPHVLVMSATPIPRTMAIILYGDLDISVIHQMPKNRLPIKNCVVGDSYHPKAYRFIEKEIRAGHQAYIICPMVEESEMVDAENVTDYSQKLRGIFPGDIVIESLHGKMKPDEKNRIMERFAAGEIQILVSTTVVEVGVNVPNATVMMVENAERFGLAQLHQLRGRVGRGSAQSYCIFVNGNEQDAKNKRLEIMNQSNDGFFIASEDLRLRGPGDMFGLRQSGILEFSIGDIFNDADILKLASEAVNEVLGDDPELTREENREYRKRTDELMNRRMERLAL